MRDNIKNTVLVLALVFAGFSLPTSIISVMNKPTITNIVNEKQKFYAITVYNLVRPNVVAINLSMEDGDTFFYSFTQEHYEREYVYVFALTSEQFEGFEFNSPFPSMSQFYNGRSYFGSGLYQVNSTNIWCFIFFVYYQIEYLTITYTVFN